MSRAGSISGEAPFASRRVALLGWSVAAVVLGGLVWVDVLPRLEPPPPTVEGTPLLPSSPADLRTIEITRGRKHFRLEKAAEGWVMVDRGERFPITDGRVGEFLSTLGKLVRLVDIGKAAEVSLSEFGLSPPGDRVLLMDGDGGRTEILLGDRNPPLTGIYVEVMPGGDVVLVGAVLLLEIDKLAALASSEATSNSLPESGSLSTADRAEAQIVRSQMEVSTHAE